MTENRILEVRAAEGGADAQLFAEELGNAYKRLAERQNWTCQEEDRTDANGGGVHTLRMRLKGRHVSALDGEAGGHRIQRVPPTEKKDKIHTSTVTVAVINPEAHQADTATLDPNDIEIEWFSGTGPGGQNRNKSMNCCRVRHKPTGLVRSAQSKSREGNLQRAKDAIARDLAEFAQNSAKADADAIRRQQVGSGMRADKKRTYRFQEGEVIDHETGRKAPVKRVMKGRFDRLWT